MNRIRIVIMVTLVLGVIQTGATARLRFGKRSMSQDVYLEKMNEALDQIIEKTANDAQKPIRLAYNLFYAHGAMIKNVPLDVLKKTVDAYKEAGVKRVDINMGLVPWTNQDRTVIEKYDAVIAYIRQSGMTLAINPQYTAAVDGKMTFEEWKSKMLDVYTEIAKRYHPETFVVVHEPTTMAARFWQRISPKEWSTFAQEAIRRVKQSSPDSQCGAGFLVWEKPYFQEFVGLDNLQSIAFDIYNLKDLETYRRMMEEAKRRGKKVYIEETWRNPYYDPRTDKTLEAKSAKGIGNADFQTLDVKWMRAITGFAQSTGLEEVTFFWPQPLFLYVEEGGDGLDPEYNKQAMEAIVAGRRTPTFEALKNLSPK